MISEHRLKERLQRNELVEYADEMTDDYRHQLKRMLLVAGDTELRSVPMLHSYFDVGVPNKYVKPILAIIQDELGHAHIDYRILEDLGEDVNALVFERDYREWAYPYLFDMPLEEWAEIAVAEGFGEFAGGILVRNVFHHTSYAPWRRALVKVDIEENFHVKFGQALMSEMAETRAGMTKLQRALDWMFPLLVEFFGPPAKQHDIQIEYRLKGANTDALRQQYLGYAVPYAESLGLQVPAHHDAVTDSYVLDFQFPCHFDPTNKQWDFEQAVTWDAIFKRWKMRGPMAKRHLDKLREGWRGIHNGQTQ